MLEQELLAALYHAAVLEPDLRLCGSPCWYAVFGLPSRRALINVMTAVTGDVSCSDTVPSCAEVACTHDELLTYVTCAESYQNTWTQAARKYPPANPLSDTLVLLYYKITVIAYLGAWGERLISPTGLDLNSNAALGTATTKICNY